MSRSNVSHLPEIIYSFLIATLPAGFDTNGNGRDREEARLDLKILRALNCNTSLPKKYIKDARKKLEAQHWQWARKGGGCCCDIDGRKLRLKQIWVSNNIQNGESLLSLDAVSRQKQQPWRYTLEAGWNSEIWYPFQINIHYFCPFLSKPSCSQ